MKDRTSGKKMNKRSSDKTQGHILTLMLVLSGLILTIWSIFAMPRAYASYDHDIKHPVIAILLQGIHDGVYPWGNIGIAQTVTDAAAGLGTRIGGKDDGAGGNANENVSGIDRGNETGSGNESGSDGDNDADVDSSAYNGSAVGSQSGTGSTDTDSTESGNTDSNTTSSSIGNTDANTNETTSDTDNGITDETAAAEETVELLPRSFTEVTDDYFNDALFVGDSRMVGLSEYCEPIDTRADFYVKKALTIYNLADGKAIRSFDGTQKTLWEVLEEKQYGKIYLMVGINEIGVGNSEYFKDAYEDVVNRIREAQPNALIFINSIMHVSGAKSNSDNLYNNKNINARNAAIATLADNISIFYLDINEAVDDENGDLRREITFDDVHLKGSSYEPWHEYLLSHGIE